MVGNVVQGEMALPSVDVDKQHSSAFLMMYKFMDDIFAIKNQMHELQKSVDDREDEIENQISGLKNTVDDRQEGLENQIIDLQEEISELKYLIGQLERQINEMGQNKGNIFWSTRQSHLFDVYRSKTQQKHAYF